jgi:hypothetical protein
MASKKQLLPLRNCRDPGKASICRRGLMLAASGVADVSAVKMQSSSCKAHSTIVRGELVVLTGALWDRG